MGDHKCRPAAAGATRQTAAPSLGRFAPGPAQWWPPGAVVGEVRSGSAHLRGGATSPFVRTFLGATTARTPFVIGVAGSVSVGKSTTARLLALLLARRPQHPRVGHHRRVPVPERRAGAARTDAPQGLPGVLRPPRTAALRHRGQGGSFSGHDPDVLPPRLRHRPWRATHRAPVRHPAHRGLNVLAPARPARTGGGAPAVSDFIDFRSMSTPLRLTSGAGTSNGSGRCVRRRSAIRRRTSAGSLRSRSRRRSPAPRRSGPRSTARTWSRTSRPPEAGRASCCAKAATTG